MAISFGAQAGILAVFLLAGIVKGTIGMGLPTVAMGLLGLVVAPAQAAALLVIPSLVTNVWQMASGGRFVSLVRRLWPMLAAVVPGTLLGVGAMTGANVKTATAALGVVLMLYGILGIAAWEIRVPRRLEAWLSPTVGLVTGLVTGATGVFVLPAVPYLQALGLAREELVQALGLSFTVSTVALALGLARGGLMTADVASLSLLALVPALAGMAAGQLLRRRLSAAAFRALFFWGITLLGGQLLAKVLI